VHVINEHGLEDAAESETDDETEVPQLRMHIGTIGKLQYHVERQEEGLQMKVITFQKWKILFHHIREKDC
jgi:hypothetical protein